MSADAGFRHNEIRAMIVHVGRLQIDPMTIGLEDKLYGPDSLGLHSINIFDLVTEIETKYGVSVPDDEIPKLNSVSDIASFLQNRLNA